MPNKPLYLGHRNRLKKRYLKSGLTGLNDYEVLELLLFFVIPRKDCKSTAKELIAKFGSFESVVEAGYNDLQTVNGIGSQASLFLAVLKDFASYYLKSRTPSKECLTASDKVKDYLSVNLRPLDKEIFMVIFLTSENEIIDEKVLFEGTIDQSAVYPREVIKQALACKSSRVIFAHNHLGRNSKPSKNDCELTKVLVYSLGLVGVKVLDHLVVSKDGISSFAENGLIEEYDRDFELFSRDVLNN